MNRGRRLRAPREDRGVLVEPPCRELVSQTRTLVDARPRDDEAATARREVLAAALTYTRAYRDVDQVLGTQYSIPGSQSAAAPRLVLAGHQPELFHPGVWAKNFALSGLAGAVGAAAVNLVVDGDVLARPTIRVPTGSATEPRVEEVPFDAPADAMPYEERRIIDRSLFASFADRAAAVLRPLVEHPLLETYWPRVLEASRETDVIGTCFARARHRLEGEWGLTTLELPQSRMCELPSFWRFTSRLLADLPRLHEAHNGALADYRRAEKIRSAGRPVPPLVVDGEWFEVPLWVWTGDAPRRRRVFVRHVGRELELTDRDRLTVRLPATPEAQGELTRRGVRLRSRALLTTMFARFALDAPFIHGIGGAKYDELTDEIVQRLFGCEPPPAAVVTATRHLPIDRPRPHGDPAALRHRLWELTHHPERFVDGTKLAAESSKEAARLSAEKRRLLEAGPPQGSARAWCQAIREVNAGLQSAVAEMRRFGEERLGETCRQQAAAALLSSREYACFLFPEKDLRDYLLAIAADCR